MGHQPIKPLGEARQGASPFRRFNLFWVSSRGRGPLLPYFRHFPAGGLSRTAALITLLARGLGQTLAPDDAWLDSIPAATTGDGQWFVGELHFYETAFAQAGLCGIGALDFDTTGLRTT